MNTVKYPTLSGEIAKRGIKKGAIADSLGIDYRTFYNKLNGYSEFTWPEIRLMRDVFFPDYTSIDELMS